MDKKRRLSTFEKAALLLFVLLCFTVFGFVFTFNRSESLIKEQLISNCSVLLDNLYKQTEDFVSEMELIASSFLQDADIKDIEFYSINPDAYSSSRIFDLRKRAIQKLNSLIPMSGNDIYFAAFFPSIDSIYCTNTPYQFSIEYFHEYPEENNWKLMELSYGTRRQSYFVKRFFSHSYRSKNKYLGNVIEVGISVQWVKQLMVSYMPGNSSIMFVSDSDGIISASAIQTIDESMLDSVTTRTQETIYREYAKDFVAGRRSDALQGNYVFHQATDTIFAPLRSIRQNFILCIALVMIIAAGTFLVMYRNIHRPLAAMDLVLESIIAGDYHVRVDKQFNNEFQDVINALNRMAERIDTLINHVYQEKMRTQEALFRQYQAQINPHFLYNCLFFIKNMAAMEENESVVSMALHLGTYYRYITRIDEPTATLAQEIDIIEHYLKIMQLRINRVAYAIEMENDLPRIYFPKLILQPIVENAVMHGMKRTDDELRITIKGKMVGDQCVISVENSGATPDSETLDRLRALSQAEQPEETSYGIWNLSQRLRMFFGPDAEIRFQPRDPRGLLVTLVFKPRNKEVQENACIID